MEASLKGRLILIAEDEPLIALDMTLAFEDEGAWVIRARTLNEALLGVEDRGPSPLPSWIMRSVTATAPRFAAV
jgi:hypothetical protein